MKPERQRFLDDPVQLDRELMGLRLHDVLAGLGWSDELPAVEDGQDPTTAVRALLGERLPAVLDLGLAVLPRTLLVRLLAEPGLLLQLQEVILCEGGPYWERLSAAIPEVAELKFPSPWQPSQFSANHQAPATQPHPVPRRARPRFGWRRLAALGAVLLFLATMGGLLIEMRLHHSREVLALRGELAQARQERDEARQKGTQVDAAGRLVLVCRSLAALSDLPPEELLVSLPPDEAADSSPVAAAPPVEMVGLAVDEPQLGSGDPRRRALVGLLEAACADPQIGRELHHHPERYLASPDPTVRDGAALLRDALDLQLTSTLPSP